MIVYQKDEFLKDRDFTIAFSDYQSTGVLHSHDFLEMAYIVSGSATHITNDKESELTQGSIIIIDYGANHITTKKSKDFFAVNIIFSPEYIDKSLFNCRSFKEVLRNAQINFVYHNDYYLFQDEDGKMFPLFEKLVEEYHTDMHGNMQYIRCLLIQILILLMRKSENKAVKKATANKNFEQIVDYVSKHYSEHLSLERLSLLFNHSPTSIYQMFQKNLNTKYADYLSDIRINAACNLLCEGNKTIEEISIAVGYKDIGSFRENFKSKMGITPKKYALEFSGK